MNEATVSGGGDTTPNDNVARDHVPISPAGQPNLVMTKEHDGNFSQGQQGAAYRLRVTNSGQAPTTGLVTVTDNLPAGLTPTSASGSGWACAIASQAVTCTRSDALAPGAGYPLIVILVNVAANATNLVNVATLTGGGDQTAVDNVSTDGTQIVARAPDLSVAKRHVDPFLAGQQGASYHITVTNTGTAPTVGEVIVVDPRARRADAGLGKRQRLVLRRGGTNADLPPKRQPGAWRVVPGHHPARQRRAQRVESDQRRLGERRRRHDPGQQHRQRQHEHQRLARPDDLTQPLDGARGV